MYVYFYSEVCAACKSYIVGKYIHCKVCNLNVCAYCYQTCKFKHDDQHQISVLRYNLGGNDILYTMRLPFLFGIETSAMFCQCNRCLNEYYLGIINVLVNLRNVSENADYRPHFKFQIYFFGSPRTY